MSADSEAFVYASIDGTDGSKIACGPILKVETLDGNTEGVVDALGNQIACPFVRVTIADGTPLDIMGANIAQRFLEAMIRRFAQAWPESFTAPPPPKTEDEVIRDLAIDAGGDDQC